MMKADRFAASLLCCLIWLMPVGVTAAQQTSTPTPAAEATAPTPADTAAPAVSVVVDLYQKAQFQEAATQGLNELLSEPWNHELRFIVADSLQRIGQLDQAMMQFEALDGTPYANSATIRLNALRSGAQQTPIAPLTNLANVTLAATTATPDTPGYQYTLPETLPVPSKVREKPVSTLRGKVVFPKRNPAAQQLHDLAAKGDYANVAVTGLALLKKEGLDAETHLLVANSLAWTGKLDDAVTQYQAILKSQASPDASVGLGNVYRWRGRDDQALPLYRAVLERDPKNVAALEGLNLAKREIRPRTLVTLGGSSDTSDATRRNLAVSQRWRDDSAKHIFEVETSANNEKFLNVTANERDLTLRYQSLSLPFQPKFELSAEGNPGRKAFANVHLNVAGALNTISIGRLNWGKLSSNANAVVTGLTANHIGVTAGIDGVYGQLTGKVDYYDISDENNILATGLRYVPSWRPLGSHFKLFMGTETRDAKTGSNGTYWSPEIGFGTAYTGLLAEWGGADWNLFGSGQVGAHLYGEAGFNWSVSAGGKRWIGNDFALSISAFKLASTRDNASYRAKAISLSLEKLWK